MSAPRTRDILRVPGRLVLNPTNIAAAYPHGGTELGVCRDVVFRPGIRTERLIAEEYKVPVGLVVTDEEAVLAGVLRTWDNDLINALFQNVQTSGAGDVGILGRVSGAGVNRAGYNLVNKAAKILFSPQAVDHHRHVVLYNAVPMLDETLELQHSIGEEFGLAFMFLATPDPQGRTYTQDLRDNITL